MTEKNRVTIRAVSQADMENNHFMQGSMMLPLRLVDTKPSQTAHRGMEVLMAFTSVYFAKSDAEATEVRTLMVQMPGDEFYILGYNGQAEMVMDSPAHYIMCNRYDDNGQPIGIKYPLLASTHMRVRILKALWDITAYYTVFPDRELSDPLAGVEITFDHDNRLWRAPVLNSMTNPVQIVKRRLVDEDEPADIFIENFPDVDGKPAAQHLCLWDNIPQYPPEPDATETIEKACGIVDPRTGKPFVAN